MIEKSLRRKLYAVTFLLFSCLGAIGYLFFTVDKLQDQIMARDVCYEKRHLSKIPQKVCESFVLCQIKEDDMKKCLIRAFLEHGYKEEQK
jgi:hypothetical protein